MTTNVGKDVKKRQEHLFIDAGLETCTDFFGNQNGATL